MGAELISIRLTATTFFIASAFGALAQDNAATTQAAPGYLESGVALFNSASNQLGSFISEQGAKTQLSVYGCLTGASGQICGVGGKPEHIYLRQSSATSAIVGAGVGAVGFGGDLQVMDRIRVSGELVWQPFMAANANDTASAMANLSGVRQAGVAGAGVKTEWVLSYDFNNALSAGLGGRYSVANADVVDSRFGALTQPKADQRSFGAFFQLHYRFGLNLPTKSR